MFSPSFFIIIIIYYTKTKDITIGYILSKKWDNHAEAFCSFRKQATDVWKNGVEPTTLKFVVQRPTICSPEAPTSSSWPQ